MSSCGVLPVGIHLSQMVLGFNIPLLGGKPLLHAIASSCCTLPSSPITPKLFGRGFPARQHSEFQ
ncbi:MAG: hypothetical protein ACYYK0_01575 [Candidatus Eutrophobiaceae bacterium]